MGKHDWYKSLGVTVSAEVGRDKKTIGEILTWRKGSTVKLEDSVVNRLNIYVNDKKIGYGSILRTRDGEMDLQVDKILVEMNEKGSVSD